MRKIQQLAYDGTRLFCPEHPNQELNETAANAPFTKFCGAPVATVTLPGRTLYCMNSAQWPTREDMFRNLKEGNGTGEN